jgi:dTDP-4-amino-4,6-dideoxygalactose transaminase
MIPYGRQFVSMTDIRFVSNALRQDLITTGCYVNKFENRIKNIIGSKYVAVCSNGTSALHLALLAINLRKNDIIIIPAINFIASYNMAATMGAKIYLADVDPDTGQMTPRTLTECIKKNNIKKIKAIITMYLGGNVENVLEFYNIKKKFRCYIIEDACHAFGSKYISKKEYKYVGCCEYSDIATFSFHPVKTLTTGEGGAITTNNSLFFERIKLYRSHGIIRKKKSHWLYDIDQSGYNYRLSDINCALGYSQLSNMKNFLLKRRKIFSFYNLKLKKYDQFCRVLNSHNINNSSCHLLIIKFNLTKIKTTKEKIINFFLHNKIFLQQHYIPIYKFKIYKKNLILKNSEEYFKSCISFPIYYNLKYKDLRKIINLIKYFINKNMAK